MPCLTTSADPLSLQICFFNRPLLVRDDSRLPHQGLLGPDGRTARAQFRPCRSWQAPVQVLQAGVDSEARGEETERNSAPILREFYLFFFYFLGDNLSRSYGKLLRWTVSRQHSLPPPSFSPPARI